MPPSSLGWRAFWSSLSNSVSPRVKTGLSAVLVGAGAVALIAASVVALQPKLIYMPRRYRGDPYYSTVMQHAWSRGVVRIAYATSQGSQIAFFYPPSPSSTSRSSPLERVWLVFGGNAALALDWMSDIDAFRSVHPQASQTCGFLLVDYPGLLVLLLLSFSLPLVVNTGNNNDKNNSIPLCLTLISDSCLWLCVFWFGCGCQG